MKSMYFTTGPNVVQWPWATSARWMRALVVTCACVALGQLGSDLRRTCLLVASDTKYLRVMLGTHLEPDSNANECK
jgi:hypothetical protein